MTDVSELPPYVRVAAYAIARDEQERILLVRISAGYAAVGQWTLPGGGLNFGEDPADGAIRELEEETGYVGEIDRLAFVASWSRDSIPEEGYGPFQAIQIVYEARLTGGGLRHEQEESTDMAAWLSFDEARTLPIVSLVVRTLDYLESRQHAIAD